MAADALGALVWSSAAVSAQLEPTRLLARAGGIGDGVQRVCDALLARRTSAAGVVAATLQCMMYLQAVASTVVLGLPCRSPNDSRTESCETWFQSQFPS